MLTSASELDTTCIALALSPFSSPNQCWNTGVEGGGGVGGGGKLLYTHAQFHAI